MSAPGRTRPGSPWGSGPQPSCTPLHGAQIIGQVPQHDLADLLLTGKDPFVPRFAASRAQAANTLFMICEADHHHIQKLWAQSVTYGSRRVLHLHIFVPH